MNGFQTSPLMYPYHGRMSIPSSTVRTPLCFPQMILSVAPAPPLRNLLTPLSIKRTLYGSSQTHGLLSLALTNNEYYDITVGYFENLPALVTLWAHTMTGKVNGTGRGMVIFMH